MESSGIYQPGVRKASLLTTGRPVLVKGLFVCRDPLVVRYYAH